VQSVSLEQLRVHVRRTYSEESSGMISRGGPQIGASEGQSESLWQTRGCSGRSVEEDDKQYELGPTTQTCPAAQSSGPSQRSTTRQGWEEPSTYTGAVGAAHDRSSKQQAELEPEHVWPAPQATPVVGGSAARWQTGAAASERPSEPASCCGGGVATKPVLKCVTCPTTTAPCTVEAIAS
jgi:hypothetical protein